VQIDLKRLIAAQPRRVFAIVADVAKWPLIIESVRHIELLTKGGVGVGTRLRETRIMLGREVTYDFEVTDFERPRRLRLIASDDGLHYEFDYIIDAVGGGTRLSLIFRNRPTGIAGRGASTFISPFLEINLRDELERDLNDLAKVSAS
jgi:hypothetical protein